MKLNLNAHVNRSDARTIQPVHILPSDRVISVMPLRAGSHHSPSFHMRNHATTFGTHRIERRQHLFGIDLPRACHGLGAILGERIEGAITGDDDLRHRAELGECWKLRYAGCLSVPSLIPPTHGCSVLRQRAWGGKAIGPSLRNCSSFRFFSFSAGTVQNQKRAHQYSMRH